MTESEKAVVASKVWAAVASLTDVDGASIDPDDNLRQTLGLDDIDIHELSMDLDATFSIELPDALVGIGTFGELVDLVMETIG